MALAVAGAKKIESSSANSVTVNGAYTATGGNLMVVGFGSFNASTDGTASDHLNGSYTFIVGAHSISGADTNLAYFKNITGGSLNLTATGGTSGEAVTAMFHEVSGADATAPFTIGESSSKTGGSTTNPTTNAVSNATANSIFFAICSDNDGSSPVTYDVNSTGSSPTGWALSSSTESQEQDSTFETMSMPFKIVTSGASTTHGWTTRNASFANTAACFIQASGGAAGLPPGLGPSMKMDPATQSAQASMMR